MPIQKPSLQKTLIQIELNRFYEKPMTRISLALVLSLLSIAFFAFAAIRPTLQTMAQLIKQIDEKKALDTQLTQKINALSVAQKNLITSESLLPALSIAIPPSADFTTLMTVIEKLASEHQVQFNSAQVEKVPLEEKISGTSVQKTTLISYPMALAFSGPYDNLLSFLRDLQALKRIIVIDRFDISASQKDQTAQSGLTLNVALRAFSFHSTGTLAK